MVKAMGRRPSGPPPRQTMATSEKHEFREADGSAPDASNYSSPVPLPAPILKPARANHNARFKNDTTGGTG